MNIVTTSVVESVAEDMINSTLNTIAANGFQPSIPSAMSGTCFTQLSTTPQGVTINATANVVLPSPAQRAVRLEGTILTISNTQVGSGTFDFVFSRCGGGTFPYVEYSQVQTAKYSAFPSLLAEPLKLDWYIRGSEGNINLQDLNGQASIKCTVKDPFPLPWGTTIPDKQVEIAYNKHPEFLGIDLSNNPDDLNYSFVLGVKVTDALNNVVTAEATIDFEGHHVEMKDFNEFMEECAERWGEFFRIHRPMDRFVKPDELVNYPTPEDIVASISRIIKSGIPESRDVMTIMKLKWGRAFDKALSLMNSGKPLLEKEFVKQ